jgi:hypothetical protein
MIDGDGKEDPMGAVMGRGRHAPWRHKSCQVHVVFKHKSWQPILTEDMTAREHRQRPSDDGHPHFHDVHGIRVRDLHAFREVHHLRDKGLKQAAKGLQAVVQHCWRFEFSKILLR